MHRRRALNPGFWRSPISSSIVAAQSDLSEIVIDTDDTYWLETRPKEHARHVLVRSRKGRSSVVVDNPFDVGTGVYEYGGGSYTVDGGTIYFSNVGNMGIYQSKDGKKPKLVAKLVGVRYGDFVIDRSREQLVCVNEDHTGQKISNAIVGISITNGEAQGLVSGDDFYLSPKISPDGRRLAWLSWNFPNMPFERTNLWLAELGDGKIRKKLKVAGGIGESVAQPEFSPDGTLYFVSDRSGWWNIYRLNNGEIEPLHEMEAEFAEAQWRLGLSSYGIGSGNLVSMYIKNGLYHLGAIDLESKRFRTIDLPFTMLSSISVSGERAVFCASSPTTPSSIVELDIPCERWKVLRRSSTIAIGRGYLSLPQLIEYSTKDEKTAFAFFYPPKNKDYSTKRSETPLVVNAHGGPTYAATPSFDLQIQFFASRGFGVVDVNYGGSTGFGRDYRQRINGMWGIIDVQDCFSAAEYICKKGKADIGKVFIRGGSSGGYTTLASLAFTRLYRGGTCYCGISDLEEWATSTHKFESRYLDMLVGRYPAKRDLYRERSPVHFARAIVSPLILLHGMDDKVAPPNQSRMMLKALERNRKEATLIEFEGEGHGIHQAAHIKKWIEHELALYIGALSG
jgi:dipeptidyl aminopeptidase/acylaminoacyl peptidase